MDELQSMQAYILDLNNVSIFLRLMLSAILGGIIGVERGRKKRPAGFRTYIVVCVASCLAIMINEYVFLRLGGVDPTRIAAQVISGIGFLGVGTIIITGRQQVFGLTTAASLWAAATIGLAVGSGFYVGAIAGCIIIFIAIHTLNFIEKYENKGAKTVTLYVELTNLTDFSSLLAFLKKNNIDPETVKLCKPFDKTKASVAAHLTLRLDRKYHLPDLLEEISSMTGMQYIEEL